MLRIAILGRVCGRASLSSSTAAIALKRASLPRRCGGYIREGLSDGLQTYCSLCLTIWSQMAWFPDLFRWALQSLQMPSSAPVRAFVRNKLLKRLGCCHAQCTKEV